MKCAEAEKMIFLDDSGELAGNRAKALVAHLHDCEPCRRLQHALLESKELIKTDAGPSEKLLQNIKREARLRAPATKPSGIIHWKPALAVAASVLIGIGLFLSTVRPDAVGLELVVTDTQLLDMEDQMVSVMYSGLSEDDLAFNFLMTYEESAEG